jgi:ABC-type polysaccharide/polyol phosphate export permease
MRISSAPAGASVNESAPALVCLPDGGRTEAGVGPVAPSGSDDGAAGPPAQSVLLDTRRNRRPPMFRSRKTTCSETAMTVTSVPEKDDGSLRSLGFSASQDIFGGLLKTALWGRLGWLEVKRRYRRTMIGPFWTSISLAMYVVAVGAVGAGLWHQDIQEYLPFLASGMVAWLLISTIINEACSLMVTGHALFRNVSFEYSILAYALVWRNLIVFFHNLVVYALIVLLLRPELIGFTALLAIPGVILVAVNGVWISLLCGMFCLRFRDVTQLVASVIQISMLITPIFWPADQLVGSRRLIFVETNPLYHLVDIVRAPLLGKVPGITSYVVVVLIAAGGWYLTYLMLRQFRRRISYWS